MNSFILIILMNSINNYLLLEILNYLTIDDILKLLTVDKCKHQLFNDDNLWKLLLDKYLTELNIQDINIYKIFKKQTYKETLFLVKELNKLKKINGLEDKSILEIYNLIELRLEYKQIGQIPPEI